MLAEASVCRLVHGEVLGLDEDQIAQEGREKERDEHAHDEGEVKEDLRYKCVRQDYLWEQARFSRSLQGLIRD